MAGRRALDVERDHPVPNVDDHNYAASDQNNQAFIRGEGTALRPMTFWAT